MNELAFLAMMEQVDKKLQAEGVPIYARPLHAMSEVGRLTKMDFLICSPHAKAIKGRFDYLTLGAHINEWYETRYGDRLKLHLGPGSVALLIRGEPWRMFLPRIYGTVHFTCVSDLEKYRNVPRVSRGKPIVANILNNIEKFSAGLAAMLSLTERKQILVFFLASMETHGRLEKVLDKPYVKEAKADLESSVSRIFSCPPQYGLSKWASLQFIEKLLKSFLELKNTPIPKHHDLTKIAQEAEKVGLRPVSRQLLASVQCSAGVRYGEVTVTLTEAMAAHHAALYLCRHLAPEIGKA
jgi:hypothetical protein